MLKNPSSDQKSVATSKFPSNQSSAIKCFQVSSAIKQSTLLQPNSSASKTSTAAKMENCEATLMLKIIDEYEKANT